MAVYRKHHVVSPSLKLALIRANTTPLFRFRAPSLSSPSMCNAHTRKLELKVQRAFFNVASQNRNIDPSIFYIVAPEEPCSESYTPVSIYGAHNEARDPPREARRNKQAQTHTVYRQPRRLPRGEGDARISARSRVPFSVRGWKAVGRLFSLRRRDEIRYFVKVISPRKVSFRRVIASAPFPPTAAALHATRAREEEKTEEPKVREGEGFHLEGRPVDIAGRDSGTPGIAAGESRAEVKDRSVTLIEGKLYSPPFYC